MTTGTNVGREVLATTMEERIVTHEAIATTGIASIVVGTENETHMAETLATGGTRKGIATANTEGLLVDIALAHLANDVATPGALLVARVLAPWHRRRKT